MKGKRYLLYGSERYALAILRPLQAVIRARGDQAAWFFDGPGANDLHDDEQLFNVQDVQAWHPYAILTGSNAVPHFFPGIKVEVFHGFDAGKPRHTYIRGFFDLYCTTGEKETAAFTQLANQHRHFCVEQTGWPKIDPFVTQLSIDPRRIHDPPVILYHSTFSPSWSAAETLYEQIHRLSRQGPWRWIVTFHPKMDLSIVERYRALENNFLRFATNDNIWELFSQVDVMCSDTSSALNEFLLTYKPVVTFKNRRPGPQLIDISEPNDLESAIEHALSRPPELMQAIRDYADLIHPYRDGRSSERVLDAVDRFVESGRQGLQSKPLNFWRKLKIRRRLKYWKF